MNCNDVQLYVAYVHLKAALVSIDHTEPSTYAISTILQQRQKLSTIYATSKSLVQLIHLLLFELISKLI